MVEADKKQAGPLQRWREKRGTRRSGTGDTPEAQAERRKQATQYDENVLQRIGEGAGSTS